MYLESVLLSKCTAIPMYCFPSVLTCTLHVYEPTVQPVASHSMFFDIKVVKHLLQEFTLLHMQFSTIPLPGYTHFSQQYFYHTYVSTHTMGCKQCIIQNVRCESHRARN